MKTDTMSDFEKEMSRANPDDPDYTNEFTETLLEEELDKAEPETLK